MQNTTKKCPMCAEEIKMEAQVCRFCGATFKISSQGYCSTCRRVKDADENNRCSNCGTDLLDIQAKSEYIQQDMPAIPLSNRGDGSVPQVTRSPRKSSGFNWKLFFGSCIILTGICILIVSMGMPKLTTFLATETPRPTRTARPTSTQTSTPTHIPTRTPTPLPIEITFDTINNFPKGTQVIMTGKLVVFNSTYCDSECGILLAKSSNSSQKITIFVRVAESGVEPLPNQMKALPDPYETWDVRICLNDGTIAFIGQRITVTGRICQTTDGDSCISGITKIELAQ